MPVPLRSTFLRLGLVFNTRYTSYHFESFTITFWGALLVNLSRWQSSTFERSTVALHFPNKFNTVSCRALSAMLPGMPDISRDSLLKYCSFSEHFHSKVLIYLVRLSVTVLLTWSSDSNAVNLVFSSQMSSFTVLNIESNLPWQSSTSLAKSSFDNLDNDCSVWATLINFKLKKL